MLVVIAGHNGAGKTTIYNERLAAALAAVLVTTSIRMKSSGKLPSN